MNILYFHQYFKTPSEPGGTRSYYLAKSLVEKGHQVTMITSRTSNADKFIEKKSIDGINVIYIRVPYNNSMGKLARIFSFLKFVIFSTFIGLKQKNIDLVFATSTPLTIGLPALILKCLKWKKYIFEVRDLWPDIPFELGIINNRIIKKMLYKFEKIIYKYSEHIIALSPGMKEGIVKKGIDTNKVSVIPNFSSNDIFNPMSKTRVLTHRLDIPSDRTICIHTGSMGKVNGLLKFTEEFVPNNTSIDFVFIGKGAEKQKLLKLSEKYENLHIIDSVNKDKLNEYLQDADFCLMIVDPQYKIFETNSANKFFEYLSAGKPIIMNYKGWKYKEIENNNCGFYIDPSKPEQLVNKIEELKKDPKLLKQMGVNSRKLAEEKFDREKLAKQFVELIEKYDK